MLFSHLEAGKKHYGKHLVRKENLHRMLIDLKLMQNFAFIGMTDSLYGLLKKKHSNETAFFDQFDKSYWNGMHNCWLSSELGAGITRTQNGLERYDGHVKNASTENLLLPVNELLGTLITWATNEARLHANSHVHAPTEHIAGKTDAKVIARIHHV